MEENNSNSKMESNNEVVNNKNIREGKKEIVVEYRKPSVFASTILILIGMLIAAVIFLLLYIFKFSKDVKVPEVPEIKVEDSQDKEAEVKEVRKLNLSPDGDFITMLYKKLPRVFYPIVHTNDIMTYDKISNNNRMMSAIFYCKSSTVSIDKVIHKIHSHLSLEEYKKDVGSSMVEKYNVDDLAKIYKSIYGADKDMSLGIINNGYGYKYEYVEEDNCFYKYSYLGGGGTDYIYLNNIVNCEQNSEGTEVYIYDRFISANVTNYSSDGNTWNVYNDYEQKNVVKSNIMQNDVDGERSFEGKTQEQFLKSYLDSDGREYKHTFKLDDAGNYYWYSSEPVK